MLKAEIERKQFKEAKQEGRVGDDGNILVVNQRGIPHVCKSTFLMNFLTKVLDALEKFMYRR